MSIPGNEEKKINVEPTKSAYAARKAAIDCQFRSQEAMSKNPFFSDPAHVAKLSQTQAIIRDFFGSNIVDHYVNHRENRGKPFTTIKIKVSSFPNAGKRRKEAQYDAPLAALGVERINSVRSNSLLFRVR